MKSGDLKSFVKMACFILYTFKGTLYILCLTQFTYLHRPQSLLAARLCPKSSCGGSMSHAHCHKALATSTTTSSCKASLGVGVMGLMYQVICP